MTAALLAPGPSLAGFAPSDIAADLIIGINRAVLFAPVHVWAFCDYARFSDPAFADVSPRVEWFTTLAAISRLIIIEDERVMQHKMRHKITLHEELLLTMPPSIDWLLFTAPAALVYAAWRGATTINCYGVDHSDAADWDGHRYSDSLNAQGDRIPGDVRNAERWQREVPIWNQVVECLASRGVAVRRLSPNGVVSHG